MDGSRLTARRDLAMEQWTARRCDGRRAIDSSARLGDGAMDGSASPWTALDGQLGSASRWSNGQLRDAMDGLRWTARRDLAMEQWTARRRDGRRAIDSSARLGDGAMDGSALRWTARDRQLGLASRWNNGRLRVAMDGLRWTARRNSVMDGRLAIDS
jgi:hypothetical protein